MATITLNIPDHTGLDIATLKSKINLYAQNLVSSLSNSKKKDTKVEESTGSGDISELFGMIDITNEEPLDELRSRALRDKYKL